MNWQESGSTMFIVTQRLQFHIKQYVEDENTHPDAYNVKMYYLLCDHNSGICISYHHFSNIKRICVKSEQSISHISNRH